MLPAILHGGHGAGEGLIAELLHPVTGLDHVVAMVAVGLWGAQLGKPALWALPVAFPMVMAVGGFLALLGVPLPGVELGIAASAMGLGLCVLLRWRPPLAVALAVVALFAVFHGHAHGTELPKESSAITYSLGFVVATGCLHAVGIGIGEVRRLQAGPGLLRAAGACVLAAGCVFLYGALA